MAQEPTHSEGTAGRGDLAKRLARALESDEFFLVYQPTIDLQTGAFAGVEALIRWRDPERGVQSPETFISELEASGLIVPVGEWALTTACSQGAEWHAKGYRFAVSVNISAKQLEQVNFVADVAGALSFSRFDPSLLVLEFSQSTLTRDANMTIGRLVLLKDLGVRLAVDDYAPGDSPLGDLERFHIDIVKLEKDFIAKVSGSSEASSQISDLVQLAKVQGMQIFASGIEEVDQRKQLQVVEVDIGQGYLFSTPHEATEIDRFLEDFAIFSGRPL
jgi:EAL domain-containing protein (putative c-di-GMP-specific phosphodiesterase class I)